MIYTLVPLGNKGETYARTRHNSARIVIGLIKDELENIEGVELFIPDSFMNESGQKVKEYLKYHEGRELVVLYDDKDLAFGKCRISHDRGDGGHNGLKSIIEHMGTKEFVRIRIGIAPHDVDGKETLPPHGEAVQDYVMGTLKEDEEESLRKIAKDVLGAIKTIVEDGYHKAMERYN